MTRAWLWCALLLALASGADAQSVQLTEPVLEHIAEIRSRNPDLRDDAFSKMGGSSVASKAFLVCFGTPYVELGDRPELEKTLAYFDTGRPSSFTRRSEAAGVSWNLRYVLGGRPAHFRREVQATGGRWALVLFGSNDAQNQNERIYLRRLVYLVEQLEEMGIVPVLGSALPRRNRAKNRWIMRFNAITEAVAEHWALPYVDYHAALSALPRQGLARDGVHPNVLGRGGVRNACRFTEEGLQYGNNLRNLLTLQMLTALRKTKDTPPPDPNPPPPPAPAPATDTATATAPDTAPAPAPATAPPPPPSTLVTKPTLPLTAPLPKNCGAPRPGSRAYRTRVELGERTRLRVSALDLDGYKPRVLWARIDDEGRARCVRRRVQTLEVDAAPGMWDLIVEVSARAARDGRMLILVTPDPR